MTTHRMKVMLDRHNGLWAQPVCEGHDSEECGVLEVFNWDAAAALENYQGDHLVLADIPIEVTEVSEDGLYWQPLAGEGKNDEDL